MTYLPKEVISYANDRSGIVAGHTYSPINADHERYGFEILGSSSDVLTIDSVEKAEYEFNNHFIQEQ